jgi:SAM-dependent methyltransferase
MITELKSFVKSAIRFPSQVYYKAAGSKVQCNICGYRAEKLMSDHWLKYAICPACHSYIRHRILYALLEQKAGFDRDTLLRNKSILHFAPESCLRPYLKKFASRYLTADYFAEGYAYKGIDLIMSMTEMKAIQNESMDCMIAIDVLEHIPDDIKAIGEIHRVLKKGGTCILSVPQKDSLEITDEDTTLSDPAEREKRFGQPDHFRIYGNDFRDKLVNAGFEVAIFSGKDFDADYITKHVLAPPIPSINPLSTKTRRIYFGKKL